MATGRSSRPTATRPAAFGTSDQLFTGNCGDYTKLGNPGTAGQLGSTTYGADKRGAGRRRPRRRRSRARSGHEHALGGDPPRPHLHLEERTTQATPGPLGLVAHTHRRLYAHRRASPSRRTASRAESRSIRRTRTTRSSRTRATTRTPRQWARHRATSSTCRQPGELRGHDVFGDVDVARLRHRRSAVLDVQYDQPSGDVYVRQTSASLRLPDGLTNWYPAAGGPADRRGLRAHAHDREEGQGSCAVRGDARPRGLPG